MSKMPARRKGSHRHRRGHSMGSRVNIEAEASLLAIKDIFGLQTPQNQDVGHSSKLPHGRGYTKPTHVRSQSQPRGRGAIGGGANAQDFGGTSFGKLKTSPGRRPLRTTAGVKGKTNVYRSRVALGNGASYLRNTFGTQSDLPHHKHFQHPVRTGTTTVEPP